jgi:SAM-dependent methyltransferase
VGTPVVDHAAPSIYTQDWDFFQDTGSAIAWDTEVFAEHTYESYIWNLEIPRLRRLVAELPHNADGVRHLDFACGTGRVMDALRAGVKESTGIDISAEMIETAHRKLPDSRFLRGDVLVDPELLDEDYDLITAFRFFLGTSPLARASILKLLGTHLRGPESLLVFNIHGNAWSVLGLRKGLRKLGLGHEDPPVLSPVEVFRLVSAAGLELRSWWGVGICPRQLYGTRLDRLARQIDRWATERKWLRWISRELVFVVQAGPRGRRRR